MKPYEEYLQKELDSIREEYPALINTAKGHKEGYNVIFAAMKRRTQAHDDTISKWLKENL